MSIDKPRKRAKAQSTLADGIGITRTYDRDWLDQPAWSFGLVGAQAPSAAWTSGNKSIAFIDPAVGNVDELIAKLGTGVEVCVLDDRGDGLVQIASRLKTGSKDGAYDSVHIISHGSAGEISLGKAVLNADTLAQHHSSLIAIGESLSENADILLYGCNIGSGPKGQALVSRLAQLTGADVAGSDDPTGSALLGGDSELEVQVGDVTTNPLVNSQDWNNLDLTLAALQSADIRDAGFLSVAAYGGASASSILAGSNWTYVDPTAFGVAGFLIDAQGYFNNLGAQALLAFNAATGTLAIAFRGTNEPADFLDDLFGGTLNFGIIYQSAFGAFVSAVVANASNFLLSGQHVTATKILVTGHSLGGAMAEEVLARNGSDARVVGVTFGSPGVQDIANNPGSDSRLINIGHVDQYTTVGANPLTTQGDPVFRQTINEHIQGSDLRVDLPDMADDSIPGLITRYVGSLGTDIGQHDQHLYENTAILIAGEQAKFGFDVRALTYVIGTDATKSFLYGTSTDNVIVGDSGLDQLWGYDGNDILDGFGGTDELRGGAGNDILDGGTGNDTAVFEQPFDRYDISLLGGKIIVAPKSWALQYEGSDTVWNSVEFFRFADGTKTWAEVQPATDAIAPTLSNRAPSDDATGVAKTTNFVLTFSEPVIRSAGNFEIRRSDGSLYHRIAISDNSQVSSSGSTVTINPTVDLVSGTNYYITIDNGAIRDQAGNAYVGIATATGYNFSTAAAADTSPPVLVQATPADNAIDIPIGADFVFYFNETIAPGSGTLSIYNTSGSLFRSIAISDASQISFGGNALVVDPSVDLAPSSSYYFNISPGAIRDATGNSYGGITTTTGFNFSTESAPYVPPPQQDSIFLSILDNSVRENRDGSTTTLTFGVVESGAGAGTRTVGAYVDTQNITGTASPAAAGVDYIAISSGVVSIPAGQTVGTVSVTILGDFQVEPDEVFRVVLSNSSPGVTLLNSSGQASSTIFATGFIVNDDNPPNHIPHARYDLAVTAPNTPIVINVLANDSDADGDLIHITGVSDSSVATISPDGQTLTVTPAPGFTGFISFSYYSDDNSPNPVDAPPPDGGNSSAVVQVLVGGDGTPGVVNSGTDGADIIVGGSGNDTLSGGLGDDIIAGGPGSDRVDGGAGFDYLDLRQATGGANITLTSAWTWSDGDGGNDILQNIEGILGTRFNDRFDGAYGTTELITTGYRFYGNDGNDFLQSASGDDVLDGGAGNDEIYFGSGRDTVFGGAGNDRIFRVDGVSDPTSDYIDGGPGNDDISSTYGTSADTILGGDGNDIVSFDNGDAASGGAGADSFYFEGYSAGGVTHASISDPVLGESIKWAFITPTSGKWFIGPITTGNGSATALDRVEYASAGGTTTLYFGYDSNPGADAVLTLAGSFSLSQLEVDETQGLVMLLRIQGGPSDDTLVGGEWGVSTDYTGAGSIYRGYAGSDTIDYSSTALGVTVDLSPAVNQATGSEIGTDHLDSIENAKGGSGNDFFTGSSGSNAFDGGNGTDTVYLPYIYAQGYTATGTVGSILISGSAGADSLVGIETFVFSGGVTKTAAEVLNPPDMTAPLLSTTSPLDNAANVAVGANIVLTFNEAVKAGSGNILIRRTSDNATAANIAVTDTSQVSFSGALVTINPTSDLLFSTDYYLTLASGVITDLANNAYTGISTTTVFNFTTASSPDTTPPTLSSTNPIDNAVNVAVGANIILTFNENVKAGSGNVLIRRTSDNAIAATIAVTDTSQVSFAGTTATINPTSNLGSNTGYYVTLASGVITDIANNPYAGISTTTAFNFTTGAPSLAGKQFDSNGDGKGDFLWQTDAGRAAIWLLNGTQLLFGDMVPQNPGATWHIRGTGDFNSDGKSDILWQTDAGIAAVWEMTGTQVLYGDIVGPNPGPTWHIKGTGDFNADGKTDILWQTDAGIAAIWEMNGTQVIYGDIVGPNPGPTWHIVGTGDFNADGRSDILWETDSHRAAIWEMNGTQVIFGDIAGPQVASDWHIKGVGDFNADGKSDILWQTDAGIAAVWLMNGTQVLYGDIVGPNPGPTWQIKGSSDLNGDGKSDILWQTNTGLAAAWLLNGTTVLFGDIIPPNPGTTWHLIAPTG